MEHSLHTLDLEFRSFVLLDARSVTGKLLDLPLACDRQTEIVKIDNTQEPLPTPSRPNTLRDGPRLVVLQLRDIKAKTPISKVSCRFAPRPPPFCSAGRLSRGGPSPACRLQEAEEEENPLLARLLFGLWVRHHGEGRRRRHHAEAQEGYTDQDYGVVCAYLPSLWL